MLKFFKNLFGSGETTNNHVNGHSHQAAFADAVSEAPEVAPDYEPAPSAQSNGHSNGQAMVQVPLHAIIAVLPLELKTRITQTAVAEVYVSVSLDQVLAQLPSGAVRISFGELRKFAPGVFSTQTDRDHVQIALPLGEILPQVNPAMLSKRDTRKQIEVPEDVRGPFGNEGFDVKFSDTKTNTGTSAPLLRSTPPSRPVPPVPPATPAAPIPMRSVAPSQSVPFRSSIASTPAPLPPTATPSGSPPVRPVFPTDRDAGATIPHSLMNGNGRASVPPSAESIPDTFVNTPLAALSNGWPEALRIEIEQLNLTEAHLALPVRVIEPALKQGKIAFPWKVLRSWIRPATLPTVSAHDSVMLELPLAVMAPLFFSHQKQNGHGRQKVEVDENIPNLFFGFPQGESAAPQAAPMAPPPPSAPEPAPIFTHAPKSAAVPDTNFYVWGDSADTPRVDETEFKRKPASSGTEFLNRYSTPNEIVSRAAALDNVAGALIALPDGLMVASKLSPELNGDTLAAFLPHIFGKISQCTKELRMGELNNLHFTVGNVPWKIFRVNAIFFAAFGRAGQPLPTAQLTALATELDRKKQ